MKSYQFQSIARIMVLLVIVATLLGTQIPAIKKEATELFIGEVCLTLLYVLTSLISWKRFF
jgi:hypothetical protein